MKRLLWWTNPSSDDGAVGRIPGPELHPLLDRVDVCFYVKEEGGRYVFANRALGSLFKLADHSTHVFWSIKAPVLDAHRRIVGLFGRGLVEILGRTDREPLAPEIASCVTATDRQVLASASRQVAKEILVNHDGRSVHLSIDDFGTGYSSKPRRSAARWRNANATSTRAICSAARCQRLPAICRKCAARQAVAVQNSGALRRNT